MLRFSQKRKDAQLNKSLIAKSLVAFTASPLLGPHSLPSMETVVVTEPPGSFVRRGFLLLCSPSSLPIEVGESLRGGDSKELLVLPGQYSTLRYAF
jgi:hypothetical protein